MTIDTSPLILTSETGIPRDTEGRQEYIDVSSFIDNLYIIIIIIIINLTPFELKAMRVSYESLKLGKTLLLL